jgi:uncharacterized membrane protein (UPF0182 family)
MQPYYVIMRLPGQDKEEFLLMLPFTPSGKTNMVAWLAAQSDVPNYGKMVVFDYPKDTVVYAMVASYTDADEFLFNDGALLQALAERVNRVGGTAEKPGYALS